MLQFGLVHLWPSNRADRNDLLHALRPVRTQFPLILLGPFGDGGYLVLDDLGGMTACFSPCVGTVSSFEEDCARRGMRVFLAEGSVSAPAAANTSFEFIPKNIGLIDSDTQISMDTWMASVSVSGDLIFQMDIDNTSREDLTLAPPLVDEPKQRRT